MIKAEDWHGGGFDSFSCLCQSSLHDLGQVASPLPQFSPCVKQDHNSAVPPQGRGEGERLVFVI